MKIFSKFPWYFTFISFTFSILWFHNVLAQQPADYFFQKLTTVNGLSSNYIQCIFRDSRGYVWIGTGNGLNRFDGKNIKVYHHDPGNPRSLPHESISQITEDQHENLWILTGSGLCELNTLTDQFTSYRHDSGNPGSVGANAIPYVDKRHNLWLGSDKGLQLFNPVNRNFETFQLASVDSISRNTSQGNAWALVEDKQHNIWFCGIKGLYKFDHVRSRMKLFPLPVTSNDPIADLLIDHEGTIWVVYRTTGIAKFNPVNGTYDFIAPYPVNRFSLFGKISEWRDHNGIYWLVICTENGLFLYDKKTGSKARVKNVPGNPNSLAYNTTYWVYTDYENILWIGTIKGLNILDNADQQFHSRHLDYEDSETGKQDNVSIETIYENEGFKMVSFIWFKGIGIYDLNWKLVKFFKSIPPSDTGLRARNVFYVYRDFRGIYWLSSSNSLVKYDMIKNHFKVFMLPDGIPALAKKAKILREIIPFDSTSFYILTLNRGIYKFDFINEKIVQHLIHRDNDKTSLPTNELRACFITGKKSLLITSIHNGIFVFDPQKNSFETYGSNPDISINEAIKALNFDHSLSGNIIWLNSVNGLVKFDLITKKFELFNSRNGLAVDALLSNEVDDHGNVWVAHNAGISRFDTTSRTFTNYSENNGLNFKEFSFNLQKLKDGNICIPDGVRLIYFNPDKLTKNQSVPQVHINTVRVLNEPHKISIDSITKKKSLTLQYEQNLITVDFSVLNFSHPNENSYYYRVDEDSSWHKLNEGIVNLVSLSPGKYVLHVTGSNGSGAMNLQGDSLDITILPPYYQTWWFRMVIVLAILFLFFMIQRMRIKTIKREEQLKTEFNKQLAQAETKALRAQMNPHFIFNSLNSINSFVIDQKHEIASDYLIKFSKLIRLILDNSRSETISLSKELETLKLYVLLESARFDNKFTCSFQVAGDVEINSVMIPPMLLQPYVENAIWHGLMQKEGNGTITIDIEKSDEEYLNISITDDGIGREKAAELKSKSATHKSHGLKVTALRIDMMNKLNSTGAKVRIVDLKDAHGNAMGTKVDLIIPF